VVTPPPYHYLRNNCCTTTIDLLSPEFGFKRTYMPNRFRRSLARQVGRAAVPPLVLKEESLEAAMDAHGTCLWLRGESGDLSATSQERTL
jgi:hypothetical protein